MKKRVDFLTDYWINDSEYHTVCVDLGRYGLYGYFAVKNGESLPVLPDAQELGGIGWYTSDSQEPYDVTSPVYEDVHIYMKKAELQTPIIHYFPIVTLATILLIMLLLDGLQVKKSRGEMPDAAKSR